MPATRASPIIRALAVAAVRRGTLSAFCRASLPMTPSITTKGQAMTRTIGSGDPRSPDQHPEDRDAGADAGDGPGHAGPGDADCEHDPAQRH